MQKHEDYAVLGGGVLGLTLALRLLQRGVRVTLYEREPEIGGLAASFSVSDGTDTDQWLEKFYHHIFRSDIAIQRLLDELGLQKCLVWKRARTSTFIGGNYYQLDSAVSLLQFKRISLASRIRMGLALAYLKLLPSPARLEGKEAATWLRRTMGGEGYGAVWEPLLRGKFGQQSSHISLPWFWARVHDRSSELGYLRGGFHALYTELGRRIVELGGVVLTGTQVHAIEEQTGRLAVVTAPTERPGNVSVTTYDGVISTLPTVTTVKLTPSLTGSQYAAKYGGILAYGAHCLVLSTDRPLTHSYWININESGFPFLVLVEHTNYVDKAEYGGRHLLYLGTYRPMNDPLFRLSKEAVMAEYVPYLSRFNPSFEPSWITQSWMFAAPYAQPIVTRDFVDHIPPFETPVPNLYSANMFQVYPHDRGQNYSIELAEKLVARLAQSGKIGEIVQKTVQTKTSTDIQPLAALQRSRHNQDNS